MPSQEAALSALERIADALEALVARPDVLLVPPGVQVEVVQWGSASNLTGVREIVQRASAEAERRASERGERIMRGQPDFPRKRPQAAERYGRCPTCGGLAPVLPSGLLAAHLNAADMPCSNGSDS